LWPARGPAEGGPRPLPVILELFSVADNDPLLDTDLTPIPVSDVVAAVFDALREEALQVYVPQFFAEIALTKAQDLEAFVSGAADYVASKRS
jgi:hypothetical protein